MNLLQAYVHRCHELDLFSQKRTQMRATRLLLCNLLCLGRKWITRIICMANRDWWAMPTLRACGWLRYGLRMGPNQAWASPTKFEIMSKPQGWALPTKWYAHIHLNVRVRQLLYPHQSPANARHGYPNAIALGVEGSSIDTRSLAWHTRP